MKKDINLKNKKIKNNTTKVIFVTGGVISGIGKGITAASIGNVLKARGYKIFMQKLDCYLNIDPGVLSPYEHGEVFVTADGGETDLDLGHYERFISETLTKESNYTTGKIYQTIFENERKGKYNGKTVQMIPHFINEIIQIIDKTIKKEKPDFHIVEIGGTIGDIESNPFIKAISDYSYKNQNDTFFAHVTYIPWIETSREFKTKPTQNSLSLLFSNGIRPNMIFLRSHKQLNETIINKISDFAYISNEYIVSLPDFNSVYKIPIYFETQKVCLKILKHFSMPIKKSNMDDWVSFVNKLDSKVKNEVNIAMVGKYIELEDSYKSIIEALFISSVYLNTKINFKWIASENINEKNVVSLFNDVNGVVVLPGFGKRGFEGKVITVNYTRENKIPTLGICFGMQAMTINQARIKGIKDATSSEFGEKGTYILDIIQGKDKSNIGGTLRLGEDKIILKENSLINKIYQSNKIKERSRHRYEVNLQYVEQLEDDEFIFSGINERYKLIEICELKNHPFYIGVQYHPEFTARPLNPSKLFSAFIQSMISKTNK